MARVQDEETGVAHGIHFREAMRRTGMCRQSFYNAMRGLARKGFIRERRSGSADYDVEIVGNAFPGKDYSCGYVNLNRKIFRDGRFRRLKAAEKCLFLHLARLIPGGRTRRMPAAALIEGLRGLASVCRRTLLGYMRSLRRMVQIRIKGGMATVGARDGEAALFQMASGEGSESQQLHAHLVGVACRRGRILADEGAARDTAELIPQYARHFRSPWEAYRALAGCMERSVDGLKGDGRRLDPRLVHRMFRKEIGLA